MGIWHLLAGWNNKFEILKPHPTFLARTVFLQDIISTIYFSGIFYVVERQEIWQAQACRKGQKEEDQSALHHWLHSSSGRWNNGCWQLCMYQFLCNKLKGTILELNFIVLCLEIDYEFVLSCLLNLHRQQNQVPEIMVYFCFEMYLYK